MTKLSVNVNKIALLRNTRDYDVPSVLEAARTCLAAGAAGITVHPRPDQRHIKPQDVYDLAHLLGFPQVASTAAGLLSGEYNIEGNPFEGPYMELVAAVRPTQATLVPDAPGQRTSDHGWDLPRDSDRLKPIVARLHDLGVRVSLFVDPDPRRIEGARQAGADRVELYTESYAAAHRRGDAQTALPAYVETARQAVGASLGVNAGHDLNLDNLPRFLREVPGVLEVSIGHCIVADALKMGLDAAVRAYLQACRR